VDTFIWPKVDTSTWPPVATFSWPRTPGTWSPREAWVGRFCWRSPGPMMSTAKRGVTVTEQIPLAVGRRHLLGISISAAGVIALPACGSPQPKAGRPGPLSEAGNPGYPTRRLDARARPRRRRRGGVAPSAIRTAWQTADTLINKSIGARVRRRTEKHHITGRRRPSGRDYRIGR